MNQFHSLEISDVRNETPDCVSIAFHVPAGLAAQFAFRAGQNITLKLPVNGEELRRSYSICSSPFDNELRIAVKHLEEGKFSTHAKRHLKIGDRIDVLPPTGGFSIEPDPLRKANYVAFAAGSGITPVISMIKTILTKEPLSSFTLIYGNRSRTDIIFREELEALKNRYMDRLAVHHILSREKTDAPVQSGRIDEEKCEIIARHIVQLNLIDHFFICGPEKMIFVVRDWLMKKGIAKEKIHFELFTVPGEKRLAKKSIEIVAPQSANVKLKLDGIWTSFAVPYNRSSILDTALSQGADLPYACKGGVCATCRAKLLLGKVEMDTNYALEQEELDAGYILTCQSHPRSSDLEIDFDAK